jgi:hypothetical protein
MNYKKHMVVFGVIALAGLIAIGFSPQFAAPLLLAAIGAFLGARKAESSGASQPGKKLWITFFILAAIAWVINRFLPEDFLNAAGGTEVILLWTYLGVLAMAFVLFGYLAYLQRVGRTANG